MAGIPFTCRVRVLHPAFSALSALQDIVVPSDTNWWIGLYVMCSSQGGNDGSPRLTDAYRCLRPASRAASRFARLTKISMTTPLASTMLRKTTPAVRYG